MLLSQSSDQAIRKQFHYVDKTKGKVRCKRCDHPVTSANGSVTAVRAHLMSHHHREALQEAARPSAKRTTSQHKHWIIAALITVLHVSFNAFSHPLLKILFWLAKLGTVNRELARQVVDDEFDRVQKLVKDNLKELKDAGAVFTLVVDE